MNHLQEYLVHEFVQDYRDGYMNRRDMIRRVLYITGGVASAATLLSSLGCAPSTPTSPTAVPKATDAPKPAAPAASSPGPSPAASPAAATAPSPAAVPSPATAASPVSAASPLPSPSPAPAAARSPISVPPNEPSIETTEITFAGQGATIMAYQAKPRGAGPFPLVLVCHENQGLTDHIRDVARRFAKEGYVGCAVDLLSREGGTNAVTDPARRPALLTGQQASPGERHVGDFQAALRHYTAQDFVKQGAYAMTGFCFGGGIAWLAATKMPELKAMAAWYGPPPPAQDVPGIKAAVFGIYSSDPQDFANNGRDQLESAFKQNNVTYQLKVYPGTQHAFNNDTGPRYVQDQALAAWKDMLDWFQRYAKG